MIKNIFSGKKYHYTICFLIAVATLAVYSNTFHASFHFDDIPSIVENYQLRDLGNLPAILMDQRGVTLVTFALNYAIGGLNVLGFHVVNIAIHIINGVLVYFMVCLTLGYIVRSGKWSLWLDENWPRRIAAYSALLFAVHPIQTQAVTYIVQRMESLASLFYLLAIILFIKGASSSTRIRKAIFYSSIPVAYCLGFYSKEIAITIPAMIFFYDLYFIAHGRIRELLKRWPLYLVLIALLIFFIVRTLVPAGGFSDVSAASAGFGVKSITSWEYLLTQFNVIVYYITLLIIPANQNLDYDFPISTGLFEMPHVNVGTVLNIPILPPVVSLLILLAIIGFAVYLYIRSFSIKGMSPPYWVISFFILWFFILLSPTSSFIPIIDVIFEHRVYLASVGFFVIFSVVFDGFFVYLARKKVKG